MRLTLAVNEIVITHAKALAGNVTPGDAAGYPVRIGAIGSYVLGSNLRPPVNQTAIQIFANNVTIDLSGYVISGSGQSAGNGIVGAAGWSGATIKNGTIEGFKFDGIDAAMGHQWIVENVRSAHNGRDGIVLGLFAVIRSSVVAANQRDGVSLKDYALFESNVVAGNAGRGIVTLQSSLIQGNTVSGNQAVGIHTTLSGVFGNTINSNVGLGVYGNGSGCGNNILLLNNALGVQADGVSPAHPNVCSSCP
jgi:hypothetical protein